MLRVSSIVPIAERPPKVLIIDEDASRRQSVSAVMKQDGYETSELASPDLIIDVVSAFNPDLILLSVFLSGTTGFEVCGELRAREAGWHTPIVLISQTYDEQSVARGLLAGADDYVWAPNRALELSARVRVQLRNKRVFDALRRLRAERDVFRHESKVDPLTGVLNRRSLERAVLEQIEQKDPFAVLFLDIDHFKSINDRFGHDIGDAVLRATATQLKRGIRPGDVCGRFGGEEFVILVLEAGPATGFAVAERHRQSIASLDLANVGYPEHLTISIGVATFDPAAPDSQSEPLVRRADSALYEAKRLGRNRVVLAPNPALEPPDISGFIALRDELPPALLKITPKISYSAPSNETSDVPKSSIELELIKKLDSQRAALPILPDVVSEALRLANDPNANIAALARLVERNPPIAARFLSLANSALYARATRVSSIQVAIVRLGLASARDLLFQIAYETSIKGLSRYKAAVARSFRRSVIAAIVARTACAKLGQPYEFDYLCGLLHDIGEAHVYRILSGIKEAKDAREDIEALVVRYHTRAGAEIASAWRLPEDIVDVCSAHHDDAALVRFPVRLVRIADEVVTITENPIKPIGEGNIETFKGLGVSEDIMHALIQVGRNATSAL